MHSRCGGVAIVAQQPTTSHSDEDDNPLYGVTAFVDAFDGFIETGYGLIEGRDELDGLLTRFLTAAYSRRYYNTLSNSTRVKHPQFIIMFDISPSDALVRSGVGGEMDRC